MTSIFISHSLADTKFTTRLAADLLDYGFRARTFKDILPPHAELQRDRLHKTVVDALENDAFVLAVLSPQFVKSRWVEMELRAAIRAEERKREVGLIPVLARECDRPEILGLRTPSDFTRSYDSGFEDLLARISAPKTLIPKEPEKNLAFTASETAAFELQNYLTQSRERLAQLSPRQFEELIAELFTRHFSLEMKLTSMSRDGGIDIVALGGRDSTEKPILIQCKRYAPDKKVGVEVVRSLFGAMERYEHSRGLIVTAAHFTAAADAEAQRLNELCRDRWSLSLIDGTALVNWLAHTPSLGPDVTAPVQQLRTRYALLVDKKYFHGLSAEEEAERQHLATTLDEADASFYEPLRNALVKERDRLLRRKTQPPKES